jgi:hypothetical protein
LVCIDPARGRLGLGDPKLIELDPGVAKWLPLFMMPGGRNHALYPFVHVTLTERGNFAGGYGVLLDTGATTSMLDRNKIDYQRSHHPSWATANGSFGDADMIAGQWKEGVLRVEEASLDGPRSVSIEIGPATFVDRPTGTWSEMFGDVQETMRSHGALANDTLLRFRMIIDYPHQRLFMEPSGRPLDRSASSSRVGLSLRFGVDGCPEVRQVTDTNAKTTRDRIQVGDVIVSVDGQDACKSWHHEISAALSGPPGTSKKLRIRRGASVVDVDAVTSELLAPASSRSSSP